MSSSALPSAVCPIRMELCPIAGIIAEIRAKQEAQDKTIESLVHIQERQACSQEQLTISINSLVATWNERQAAEAREAQHNKDREDAAAKRTSDRKSVV